MEYHVISGFSSSFAQGSPIERYGFFYEAYREEGRLSLIVERGKVLIDGNDANYQTFCQMFKENELFILQGRKEGETIYISADDIKKGTPDSTETLFMADQLEEVAFDDERYGRFVLNRQRNQFIGAVMIGNEKVKISLESPENIEVLWQIGEKWERFLSSAVRFAAGTLLESANKWHYIAYTERNVVDWDNEENDDGYQPLTKEDFVKHMALESISIVGDGDYTLWYDSGDLFLGHLICLEGNAREGITKAVIQG